MSKTKKEVESLVALLEHNASAFRLAADGVSRLEEAIPPKDKNLFLRMGLRNVAAHLEHHANEISEAIRNRDLGHPGLRHAAGRGVALATLASLSVSPFQGAGEEIGAQMAYPSARESVQVIVECSYDLARELGAPVVDARTEKLLDDLDGMLSDMEHAGPSDLASFVEQAQTEIDEFRRPERRRDRLQRLRQNGLLAPEVFNKLQ